MYTLDDFDIRILKTLDTDGRMAYSAIATEMGVSNTMVHQRISRLSDQGILEGTKPVLNEKNSAMTGELSRVSVLKRITTQSG